MTRARNHARLPPITRRGLLTRLGAGAMSLPFLSSLATRSVHAAQGDAAKRLIVFFTPNDAVDRDHWLPQTSGSQLTALAPMMAPLSPFMDKLTIVGDLEMKTRDVETFGAGHIGIGHMLTGRTVTPYGTENAAYWASGISVDQHVANHLGVDALTLGTRPGGNNGNSRISYAGPSQPVHPITQPDDAFEALFADATLPADELAELRARRLSILDRVAGDLQGLGSTLPGEAADKVAIHLDLVRDLETKLQDDVALTCEPIGVAGGIDYGSNANVPLCVRRQVDVMVQALACGLTDVASLQLGNSGSGDITPLWDAEGIDINIDCHTIAHDYNQGAHANAVSNRIALETVFFDLFAYLLQQLDATPEGEGTMLDNSLVLWTKNLGFNHASKEMLYILAGGASGALETGRFLSFPGLPHNDLLASICQLMGMSDTTFGDPELCTGPLAL